MKSEIEIHFKHGIDENRKLDLLKKEWCDDVIVTYGGKEFDFEFISFLRLRQEFEYYKSIDRTFLVDRNTIVLPDVSYESIVGTIDSLAADGYFEAALKQGNTVT